ncbi:MAG: SDR family NAD(P)-dependent oxidoreductase [Solirubrobacterales bacterium]
MELIGKKVLLTGATGGLGRSMASRLAASGAELIVSGRKAEALESLIRDLPGPAAGTHSLIVADLGETGAALALAEQAGEVDCLVANAALPSTGRLTELTDEQVARMLRINLEAPILLSQALLPAMLERGSGKLVLIGSLAGKAGSPRSSIYNATKFGIRGFAFGLKPDLAGTGVDVTLVAPGFVRDAGMFADAGIDAPAGMGTTTPEQVAAAVLQAIRSNKLEITVAPAVQRTMAHMGLISPALSHRIQSGNTGQSAAEELAANQADKR